MNRHLRRVQLATAAILLPLILCHLGFVFYAGIADLSAADILERTRGGGWAIYYGVLVVAVAIHGPLGLRNVLLSWTAWRGFTLDCAMVALTLLVLITGARAVTEISALADHGGAIIWVV